MMERKQAYVLYVSINVCSRIWHSPSTPLNFQFVQALHLVTFIQRLLENSWWLTSSCIAWKTFLSCHGAQCTFIHRVIAVIPDDCSSFTALALAIPAKEMAIGKFNGNTVILEFMWAVSSNFRRCSYIAPSFGFFKNVELNCYTVASAILSICTTTHFLQFFIFRFMQ